MTALKRRLDRWVREGLISDDQAAAIREFEDGDGPGDESPGVGDALVYLGASLVMVGAIVAASRAWDELTVGGRIAFAGSATAALLAAGAWTRRSDRAALRRMTGFLWLLGAAGAGFLARVVARELGRFEPASADLAAGLAMAATGAFLWRARRSPTQHLAVFLGLALAVESALNAWPASVGAFGGLPLSGLGLAWVALAWGGLVPGRRTAWILGGVTALAGAGALTVSLESTGLFGTTIGLVLLAAGAWLGASILLWAGGAGIILFVPVAVFHFFGDALGVPLALLVAGAALLAVALAWPSFRGLARTGRNRVEPAPRRRAAVGVVAALALGIPVLVWWVGVRPLPSFPPVGEAPEAPPGVIAALLGEERCLHVVSASGGTPRRLLCPGEAGTPPDPWGIRVGWTDGGRIELDYPHLSGGTMFVVDPSGVRPLEHRMEDAGGRPARNPDGTEVSVRQVRGREWVVAVQPRTAPLREILRLEGPPRYRLLVAKWSPDGSWVGVLDSEGQLFGVPSGGSGEALLLVDEVTGDFAWGAR